MAVSNDGGKKFGEATKLGTGAWPLKACPMDGGAIAVAGNQVSSAWRRDKSLFLVRSGNPGEQLFGP